MPLLFLSKSNPLRWASIWVDLPFGRAHLYCLDNTKNEVSHCGYLVFLFCRSDENRRFDARPQAGVSERNRRFAAALSAKTSGHHVGASFVSLAPIFFKNQIALTPLLLLSKSQPLTLGCDLALASPWVNASIVLGLHTSEQSPLCSDVILFLRKNNDIRPLPCSTFSHHNHFPARGEHHSRKAASRQRLCSRWIVI